MRNHRIIKNEIKHSEKIMNSEKTKKLSLYETYACPFCMRVQYTIRKLGINIESRNIQKNNQHRKDLLRDGGYTQVPCLRIEEENETRWLYESREIINYLENSFA
jgi:glutathione S-transferase